MKYFNIFTQVLVASHHMWRSLAMWALHKVSPAFGSPGSYIAYHLTSKQGKRPPFSASPCHYLHPVNDIIWCLLPNNIYEQLNHSNHHMLPINSSLYLSTLGKYWFLLIWLTFLPNSSRNYKNILFLVKLAFNVLSPIYNKYIITSGYLPIVKKTH